MSLIEMLENGDYAVCVIVDMRHIDCKIKTKLVLNCCNVYETETREGKIDDQCDRVQVQEYPKKYIYIILPLIKSDIFT